MPSIALIGFLDTKFSEYSFLRKAILDKQCSVTIIDTSLRSPEYKPEFPIEYPPNTVCAAVQEDIDAIRSSAESDSREKALAVMATGSRKLLERMAQAGDLIGVVGIGGSTSTSLICEAMRPLPIGLPKICVSTMASGEVAGYIGDSDIILMPSIVDISGVLNPISQRILSNAAASICGMSRDFDQQRNTISAGQSASPGTILVGVTMFGLTTPCVTAACDYLRQLTKDGKPRFEPVVFHATGSGGRTMERLLREKWLRGVLDITTTELADELCGGVLTAGPDRLSAASQLGVPQVVSLGALDMINFGAASTVPEKYKDRIIHKHNSAVTLVRTSTDECKALGIEIASKLKSAKGPTKVVIPLRGWSGMDREGAAFRSSESDGALVNALKEGLGGSRVEVIEMDLHINDKEMGVKLATVFAELFT